MITAILYGGPADGQIVMHPTGSRAEPIHFPEPVAVPSSEIIPRFADGLPIRMHTYRPVLFRAHEMVTVWVHESIPDDKVTETVRLNLTPVLILADEIRAKKREVP